MSGDAAPESPVAACPSTWHLCWQAAVGRELFPHPSFYGRVRARLLNAHGKRGRVLLHYVMLPTEIHVLARLPPGESPGAIARAIGNVVSRWVRQTQPVRSPVLAGPHRAHQIESMSELRHEVRMLSWRPVHLGVSATPSQYPHSALRIALGLSPVHGFDSRPVLQLFGTTVPQARAALRAWVRGAPSERLWREWELTRGLRLAMGSVGTQPDMAREVRAPGGAALVAAGADGIDGALHLIQAWVASKLDLRGDSLREGKDAASARGRALVACIAVRHQVCSASAVARYFGRAKATLSEQMSACRARADDRTIIATAARRIVEEVGALAEGRSRPAGRQHRLK